VWNQIRRTDEEAMEMGTREYALLQVHSIRLEKTANMATGTSETAVSSICAAPICFTWRSEEEVMDGGHMIVPSIGQDTPSSIKAAISCATETSGRTHIVPITWQMTKKITNTMGCITTR